MNKAPRIPFARTRLDGLLTGATLLLVSMTVVNGGNYLLNVVLGRWLGPAAFSDLSLLVTFVLMLAFVSASFQLVAARFAAGFTTHESSDDAAALRRWLQRLAWALALPLSLLLVGGADHWQSYFQTDSSWPFVILGAALPVYFLLGVDRGLRQGEMAFAHLSASYFLEMLVRFLGGVALVMAGWGVNGAVLAMALSFVAGWVAVRPPARPATTVLSRRTRRAVLIYAGPVILAHLSQILINNGDILVVKRTFGPELAGQYAAVALIGRVVFFATWSVVTAQFPLAAQNAQRGESHRHILATGLALTGLVAGGIVTIVALAPAPVVAQLFGADYVGIAPLLAPYALATALYTLANVVVTYLLAIGRGGAVWLALLAGVVQVGALTQYHTSLALVVNIQVAVMGAFFIVTLIWESWTAARLRRATRGRRFAVSAAPDPNIVTT